ncbi:MAG TPA: hypothetical protein DIT59_01810 [Leclercia sp.]|nr:hypothetical protein [Leclercia sp.]
MPVFQPRERGKVVCVVFCSPSAETIHQGLGAHYTLINAQKENENSVSKILYAVSQRIVIKALRFTVRMLQERKSLRQTPQIVWACLHSHPIAIDCYK